jgi:hypothetical protein
MEKIYLVSIQYAVGSEGEAYETINLATFTTAGAAYIYSQSEEVIERVNAHYLGKVCIEEIPFHTVLIPN